MLCSESSGICKKILGFLFRLMPYSVKSHKNNDAIIIIHDERGGFL